MSSYDFDTILGKNYEHIAFNASQAQRSIRICICEIHSSLL